MIIIRTNLVDLESPMLPVSILRKSISGRHRPVRVADGPMTADVDLRRMLAGLYTKIQPQSFLGSEQEDFYLFIYYYYFFFFTKYVHGSHLVLNRTS